MKSWKGIILQILNGQMKYGDYVLILINKIVKISSQQVMMQQSDVGIGRKREWFQ